jgi:hypothetical protein
MIRDGQGWAEAVARLWESVAEGPLWHSGSCSCTGGGGCILINLRDAQVDLMDHLLATVASQDPPLQRLLRERLATGSDADGFAAWIRQLPASGLTAQSVERLLERIERFADSLRPPARSRIVYTALGEDNEARQY